MQAQKCFLGHVFRFFTGAHHAHQKTKDPALMALDQDLEGTIVSPLPTHDQLAIRIVDHRSRSRR
jgi:hypothetical protein